MLNRYRSKILILIGIFLVATVATAAVFFLYLFPANMRNDFDRFSNEGHDTVFLSMYPIENYEEDIYTYWRGMDAIITSHEIPNLFTLKNYLRKINETGTVTTIYLGVLPEKLDAGALAELLLYYPHIRFEVILPYPSLDYWLTLSEEECDSLLQTYRDFIPPLLDQPNFSPYFFGGAEWLIANPANYDDTFLTTAKISETLMLNSDRDHSYVLTAATQPSPTASVDTLADLISRNRTDPAVYPDLSDWNIVFLGDSVIGNYTDTTGVPGVTAGLTGANIYNIGYGGGSATDYTEEENCSLYDIVNALIQEDLSPLPPGTQLYSGMKHYLEDSPEESLCFVINYGLNDYFNGAELESADSYDIHTFAGSVRSSVRALQDAFPKARILLNTPNLVAIFEYGTEPRNGKAYTQTDYADTLITIAEEMNVDLLDNYNEIGITAENWPNFLLPDGCHPNETGRFLIGQRIALKFID